MNIGFTYALDRVFLKRIRSLNSISLKPKSNLPSGP